MADIKYTGYSATENSWHLNYWNDYTQFNRSSPTVIFHYFSHCYYCCLLEFSWISSHRCVKKTVVYLTTDTVHCRHLHLSFFTIHLNVTENKLLDLCRRNLEFKKKKKLRWSGHFSVNTGVYTANYHSGVNHFQCMIQLKNQTHCLSPWKIVFLFLMDRYYDL